MARKKHRRYRLKDFDYARNGAYFITIVSQNRSRAFGEIIDGEMRLSNIGKFVEYNINLISMVKQDVRIDEYQVMPDHVHLIVTIRNPLERTSIKYAPGLHPLIPGSLSSFINHFKGKVTRWCNENGIEGFKWQAKFHDRIIRDNGAYRAIQNYIRTNVQNWKG